MPMHLRLLLLLAFAAGPVASAAAQVTVDGSTATTVVIGADGAVTVGVAPAASRDSVSVNRYRDFNVPPPGVALDNRRAAARTIVNEVTGTGDSRLEGPLEVLGQRAHVIVANPNGIVIDNGRFINTGRVALTTGVIGSRSQQIAPGIFQQNVTSNVTGGRITVRGGGLSGQMDAIDLIARSVRIDGPVINSDTGAGASVRIVAGQSLTEFDSSVLVGNTNLDWGRVNGGGASDGVLVEIGQTGLLQGGRIEVLVNDAGAGVRYAGDGRATSRGFVLSGTGAIDLMGADFSGRGGMRIEGRDIALDTTRVALSDGVIQARASGAVRLLSSDLSAPQAFIVAGADLAFDDTVLTTEGDTVLRVAGDLASRAASVATGASLQASVGGTLSVSGGIATAFANILLNAKSATLTDTRVEATNGSLIASTAGDLTSVGSRLQGGTRVDGIADARGTQAAGAVTLDLGGTFRQTSAEALAIVFGAGDGVSISAADGIENDRGRILANGDIDLVSPGDVLNLLPASGLAQSPEISTYTRSGKRVWWTLWLKRKRIAGSVYDYGTLAEPDRAPVINAGGDLRIRAATLRNAGGEISASAGDLVIDAVAVETIGLGSGKVAVETVCVLVCSAAGSGAVSFVGGQMNASDAVRISASDSFTSTAGQVFGGTDVTIDADSAILAAALVPTLIERPAGLYNFWQSRDAWVLLRDQFGTVLAETGTARLMTRIPVTRIGGEIAAGDGVTLSAGETLVRAPGLNARLRDGTIGWLAGWPFVSD